MPKTILLLCICIFSARVHLHAQCPVSGEVWSKVEKIKQNSNLSDEVKLSLLKDMESTCIKCGITDDSSFYSLQQRIGVLYYYQNDYINALLHTEKAIRTGSLQNGKNKADLLPQLYYNQAMIFKLLKDSRAALAAFDSSLAYLQKYPDKELSVFIYRNLANLYMNNGDFQKSVSYAEKGEVLAREMNNLYYQASCMGEKAWSLMSMKQYDEAERIIGQALRLYLTNWGKTKPYRDEVEDLGNLYITYASILRKQEKPIGAVNYYQKAFAISRQYDYPFGSFVSLNNIGDTYYADLSDNKKARQYYLKALKYSTSANDSLLLFSNLGDIECGKGNYQNGLELYQQALMIAHPAFRNADPKANPAFNELKESSSKVYLVSLLTSKGNAWLNAASGSNKKKNLLTALDNYDLADKLVDAMLYEQDAVESKITWREKVHQLYENAIETCYRMNDADRSFYYFEKSRAFILSDQLIQLNWFLKKDPENLSRQSALKRSILECQRQLKNTQLSDESKNRLVSKIFESRRELETLVNEIKKRNPYYYKSYLDPESSSIEKVKKNMLGKTRSLVELFVGDSAVYMFRANAEASTIIKIDKPAYTGLTEKYIAYCSDNGALNRNFPDFEKVSNQLFILLFPNKNDAAGGQMIISPEGTFFPFESLVTGYSAGSVHYLVEKNAISYTYSAKFLLNSQSDASDEVPGQFLGVAPVKYDKSLNLASLANSDGSLDRIKGNFDDPSLMLDTSATRRGFLAAFNNYRIIQLYTHASDSSNSGEPVIYFADSALYLSDLIIDRPVATRFIFLSACQTGLGKQYRGEGIFNFNRGFAVLGIPSCVSTLWQVDNASTYRITEFFYHFLSKGFTKDIALQKAKIRFIREAGSENKLPYYWAGPVLVGTTEALFSNQSVNWVAMPIVLLLAALVLMIFVIIRKKTFRISPFPDIEGSPA